MENTVDRCEIQVIKYNKLVSNIKYILRACKSNFSPNWLFTKYHQSIKIKFNKIIDYEEVMDVPWDFFKRMQGIYEVWNNKAYSTPCELHNTSWCIQCWDPTGISTECRRYFTFFYNPSYFITQRIYSHSLDYLRKDHLIVILKMFMVIYGPDGKRRIDDSHIYGMCDYTFTKEFIEYFGDNASIAFSQFLAKSKLYGAVDNFMEPLMKMCMDSYYDDCSYKYCPLTKVPSWPGIMHKAMICCDDNPILRNHQYIDKVMLYQYLKLLYKVKSQSLPINAICIIASYLPYISEHGKIILNNFLNEKRESE